MFAESKVGEFDVAVSIQEDVVGFEIAVDIFHFVDGIECQQNFCSVKLGLFVGEDVLFDEQIHEIPAGKVLHDQVQVLGILKGAFQTNNPRIFFRYGQNVPFLPRLNDLVLEDHLGLFELFDCDGLAVFGPLAESDFAEGPLADDFDGGEVADGEFESLLPEDLGFLVENFVFELLLFFGGDVEHFHFFVEFFPIFFLLLFLL